MPDCRDTHVSPTDFQLFRRNVQISCYSFYALRVAETHVISTVHPSMLLLLDVFRERNVKEVRKSPSSNNIDSEKGISLPTMVDGLVSGLAVGFQRI